MSRYLTSQRKCLLEYLENNPDRYFTAYEVFSDLKDSRISLSSVYRNLKTLCADGMIEAALGADGRETVYRFIGTADCLDHLHLTCVSCGKTFHADSELCDKMKTFLLDEDQFSLSMSKTVLYGTCSLCSLKKGHTNA